VTKVAAVARSVDVLLGLQVPLVLEDFKVSKEFRAPPATTVLLVNREPPGMVSPDRLAHLVPLDQLLV
jgi:hypothetical protein